MLPLCREIFAVVNVRDSGISIGACGVDPTAIGVDELKHRSARDTFCTSLTWSFESSDPASSFFARTRLECDGLDEIALAIVRTVSGDSFIESVLTKAGPEVFAGLDSESSGRTASFVTGLADGGFLGAFSEELAKEVVSLR